MKIYKIFFFVLFLPFTFLFSQTVADNLLHNEFNNLRELFVFSATNNVTTNYRVDSVQVILDSTSSNMHKYVYNENQKVIIDSSGYYSGGNWVRISKNRSTYNLGNNLDSLLIEYWNAGGYWMKFSLAISSYNNYGKITSLVSHTWNNNAWENSLREFYFYNNDGVMDSSRFYVWGDSSWINNSRSTYQFDENGNMSSRTIQIWLSPENVWQNSGFYSYTYDGNGNEIERLEKNWVMNTWNDYRKITTTYNANNQKTSWLEQTISSTQWIDVDRVTYLFDENENMNYASYETWERVSSAWNKKMGSIVFEDRTGQEFALIASEINVFYNEITDVKRNSVIPMNYELFQNYPNPFNPTTQISFTIPSSGVVKLNIYNVLGEIVAEIVNERLEAGFHEYQFDADNLTSGIYFYSISVNGFREVKKMNLIK